MKKSTFTIHDLPVAERPRERLQQYGESTLSSQELLAVILGRGIAGESVTITAQRLLKEFGDLKGLAQATVEELSRVKGIGPAKTCLIKAAFELVHRNAVPEEMAWPMLFLNRGMASYINAQAFYVDYGNTILNKLGLMK